MPVCRVLGKSFCSANEVHIPIALLAVATIGVVGGCKPAPELRAGVAQQAADIGLLVPTHHGTSSYCTSMWPRAAVAAFDDFEIAPAKGLLRVQALPKHGVRTAA